LVDGRLSFANRTIAQPVRTSECNGPKDRGHNLEAAIRESDASTWVEHYEMAGHMTAISFVQKLGSPDVVGLLKQSLTEKNNEERKLRRICSTVLKSAHAQ
jgi:ferritin-like metal-binding protein YciE